MMATIASTDEIKSSLKNIIGEILGHWNSLLTISKRKVGNYYL